ncbi:hypothetical protein OG21DRAFT_1491614 [Imleria badia]|nr:hypothetical protein OG21DRAFT_1491614 [Imleria badia]
MSGRCLQVSGLRDSASQRPEIPHLDAAPQREHESSSSAPLASCISGSSSHPSRSSQFNNYQSDPPTLLHPTRLQQSASFYNQPLCMNRPGHSIFAAPELNDEANFQIDKASPSKDKCIAEVNLHRADESGSRDSAPHDNDCRSIWSPPLNDPEQVSSRTCSQSRDEAVIIHSGRNLTLDGDDRTSGAIPQYQQSQHVSRPPSVVAPSQPPPNQVAPCPSGDPAPKNVVHSCPPSATAPSQPPPNQVAPCPSGDPAPENVVYSCPPSAAAPSQPQPNQVAPCPSGDPAPENVVNIHRQCNRAPRLPSNSRLLASRQQQQALSIDRAADEVQSNGNADGQDNPSVNHSRYKWDPKNCHEHNSEIAKTLLGNGGQFLRDGTDEEGHVNNLAHLALSGLIVDFFYTWPTSIGTLFSEVFVGEVLRVTVAFAATAICPPPFSSLVAD